MTTSTYVLVAGIKEPNYCDFHALPLCRYCKKTEKNKLIELFAECNLTRVAPLKEYTNVTSNEVSEVIEYCPQKFAPLYKYYIFYIFYYRFIFSQSRYNVDT